MIPVSLSRVANVKAMFRIKVDCYAGYKGEQTPLVIHFDSRTVRVLEIMDRWLSPDHRYFKVKGHDQAIYIIRHDPYNMDWQLIFYHLKSILNNKPIRKETIPLKNQIIC